MKPNKKWLIIFHYVLFAISVILWLVLLLSPDLSLTFHFIFLGYVVCYTIYHAYERQCPDTVVVSKAGKIVVILMTVVLVGKLIFF